MKLPIAAATLALTAGLAAPAASGADFWLRGLYSGPMVKRNCDTHGGEFYMRGGLRYGCELAYGRAVECTENHRADRGPGDGKPLRDRVRLVDEPPRLP